MSLLSRHHSRSLSCRFFRRVRQSLNKFLALKLRFDDQYGFGNHKEKKSHKSPSHASALIANVFFSISNEKSVCKVFSLHSIKSLQTTHLMDFIAFFFLSNLPLVFDILISKTSIRVYNTIWVSWAQLRKSRHHKYM